MVELIEKIFGLTETGELINNETGRVYCVKGISALDLQDILNRLIKENKELKKELFEVKEDYILETYADNPSRRDVKLEQLKKELI